MDPITSYIVAVGFLVSLTAAAVSYRMYRKAKASRRDWEEFIRDREEFYPYDHKGDLHLKIWNGENYVQKENEDEEEITWGDG